MSTRLRSSSVGSKPKPRLHRTSRAESAQAVALDVRCACQFYETKLLLPERVNPVGYNTAEEFGPCVHVQAKLKNLGEPATQSGSETIVSSTSVQSATMPQPHDQQQSNDVQNIPPEFAPENLIADSNVAISSSDRSASCNNMGGAAPQLMKQRDPSTSSLLRKRMSEERPGFPMLNKRMSQSTVSRDQISQKDPAESTILRRKMYNRSSGSFDRASSEMASNERFQPIHFQQSRIPNERTFYHDSNEFLRNPNMEFESPKMESSPPREMMPAKVEPLSMQSQGNRRYVLGSTENLPQRPDLHAKTSVETEPDSGIDSNFIEDAPRKTDTEKQLMQHNGGLHGENVCDEEKVLLLSKTQNSNVDTSERKKSHPTDGDKRVTSNSKRKLSRHGLQLMKVEDVQAMELPAQSKVQIQYLAKFDSILRPQEAETNEYSYSKIFDNYKGSQTSLAPVMSEIPNSTPDLRSHGSNYIKQRDPSQSVLLQNRYRTTSTPKPTPRYRKSDNEMPLPMDVQLKSSHEKLLPPAGEYPERRASEVASPHLDQQMNPQFIRQKDMRTSNILNRRRRNLSHTSLGRDAAPMIDQPFKITKTISFEKNLAQSDSDQMSPYTIQKGVSFEFGKPLPSDRIERLDFSNSSASRRPFR